MKRTLVILLAIISLNAKSQEQMSYLQNEDTIKFSVSEELYSITYDDTLENLIKTRFIDDFMKIGNGHAIIKISNVSGKDFDDKREILQDSFEGIVYSIEPVLIYEDGTIQMTHNAILVQANDQRVLSQIFSDYNYTVEEIKVVNLKNFLVKIDGLSTIEIFQIVSKHCHDKNIISIEPSFIRIIQVDSWETPNDPLFSDQWNIFGNQYIDTKVINAWSITKGENVKTAIFDGGIDLNHPDLIDNIVGGYDATNHNTNGGYHDVWEAHGTECAGIVAAKGNNDIGIVGVAPNSKIFSVKIAMLDRNGVMTMSDSEFARGLAESIRQGARIFSNSWGGGSQSANRTNNINSCINNAYDGKGCVVVFASGNKNNPSVSYPSSLSSVISVGAISPCGERKSPTSCDGENWGSNYGTGLNVVAPGVFIPTTDISGVLGATSSDYNMAFNGTSAACPFVAGVAALVLSVNPNLTQKQVKDIIEQTAQKIRPDLYDYNTYATRPNGTWNIQMGYGLVDAYAAVQKAKDMDLYIRDVETDNGVEPSNTNGCMWNSPDIWIEDFDNNVVDNPRGGEEYYVCVRVHNNKNISSTGTEKLYLNWAKAGTDLRWRSSWDGEHFFNCDRAVLKGDVIDEDVPIPSIAANSSIVVRVPWVVPVAERYMSCSEFDSELWHFCLVARVHDGNEIVNDDDENGDMAYFVERNNNVAWKNLSVLSSHNKGAVVSVSNPFREKRFFRLTYKSYLNKAGEPLEKFADVYLMLDEGLLDAWKVSGCKGSGFKQVSNNMFLMTDREVVLDNLYLHPDEHHTIQTDVCFFTQSVPQDSVFDFDIALYYWDKEPQIIGGEHYMAIKNMDRDFKALALNDTSVLMSQAVSFSAVNINEPAQYTWYDVNGDTVGTGMNLTVQPMTSQQYKLEVVAEADGAKDYDTVSVAVRGGMLVSLSPNPANDRIDVEYRLADNVSNALIQIVSSTGIIVNTIPITNTQTSITINIQALASGSYSVGLLLPNGEIPDMKTLIVR